jgi:hypothetical protein
MSLIYTEFWTLYYVLSFIKFTKNWAYEITVRRVCVCVCVRVRVSFQVFYNWTIVTKVDTSVTIMALEAISQPLTN